MSAQPIDGRGIAKEILNRLKNEIVMEKLDIGFVAILVGDNPASRIYIRLKERAATELGMRFERIHLEHGTSQDALETTIKHLNARPDIHAILLQLPLPPHLNADTAIRLIDPEKDVDGFHPQHTIEPVLSQAVLMLIRSTGVNHRDHTATIVCNSPDVFAPPLTGLNTRRNGTPQAQQSRAIHWPDHRTSLLLPLAAALHHRVGKPGATIIDIGINKKMMSPWVT